MATKPWKVLVIDDDEGIHSITRMVFRGYEFENRPIQLINALSGTEAKTILEQQSDIALALLDAVMETDDAGLQLVNYIREQSNNKDLRIILRTGHPGFAPEAEVIIKYDINDYLSKAELSASRLLTSVVVALRSYRDIQSAKSQPVKSANINTLDNASAIQLLADFSEVIDKSLQPIKSQASKLKQFTHKPMISDLVNDLSDECEKLKDLNLLIKPITASKTSHLLIDTELDRLLKNYLAQAKNENWLIDYQIDENIPSNLNIDATWFNTLLVCLLELAISKSEQTDLTIYLYAKHQRINIDLQGTTSKHSSDNQWQQYLSFKLAQLSEHYQGNSEHPTDRNIVSYTFGL